MTNTLRLAGAVLMVLPMRLTGFRFTKEWRHAEAGRTDCGRWPAAKAFVYGHLVDTICANAMADDGFGVLRFWAR